MLVLVPAGLAWACVGVVALTTGSSSRPARAARSRSPVGSSVGIARRDPTRLLDRPRAGHGRHTGSTMTSKFTVDVATRRHPERATHPHRHPGPQRHELGRGAGSDGDREFVDSVPRPGPGGCRRRQGRSVLDRCSALRRDRRRRVSVEFRSVEPLWDTDRATRPRSSTDWMTRLGKPTCGLGRLRVPPLVARRARRRVALEVVLVLLAEPDGSPAGVAQQSGQ